MEKDRWSPRVPLPPTPHQIEKHVSCFYTTPVARLHHQ